MNIEDEHFLNLFKGKRVRLSLRTSSYLGTVQRVNADRSLLLEDGENLLYLCLLWLKLTSCLCLWIVSVVHGSSGCHVPGTKVFFGREVVNGALLVRGSLLMVVFKWWMLNLALFVNSGIGQGNKHWQWVREAPWTCSCWRGALIQPCVPQRPRSLQTQRSSCGIHPGRHHQPSLELVQPVLYIPFLWIGSKCLALISLIVTKGRRMM